LRTSDFAYHLPLESIAQTPIEPRDAARLLVMGRNSGKLIHANFHELGNYLSPGDLLVLNETRVIPARLFAHKIPTGGRAEILLLRQQETQTWEVLVGGHKLRAGRRLQIIGGPQAEIIADLDGSRRLVRFDEPLDAYLPSAGHVPLPPYIHRVLTDPERYQTVYAQLPGSAAAPTAGLHFTPELILRLKKMKIEFTTIVLHVGLDTFAPVTEDDPGQHIIHTEWCQVTSQAAQAINRTHQQGGRVIAVGTTSVRTLENAAATRQNGLLNPTLPYSEHPVIIPYEGPTDLFILPGFEFRVVDGMVTNFHLPCSTLIMLVSAFAGRERILDAYNNAQQNGYRFYSFGDAMLII